MKMGVKLDESTPTKSILKTGSMEMLRSVYGVRTEYVRNYVRNVRNPYGMRT